MSYTNDQVLEALRHVDDPDLKKDLVTLNMIEDVRVDGKKISFKVVLTTPACPMKNMIRQNCISAIHQFVGEDAEVEIEMTARVTSARKQMEDVLAGVKNIIAVGSGKGGVGKSTVAANLAVALAKSGARVGLMDADIYGPSIPMMFGLMNEHPVTFERDGKGFIFPVEKFGVKLLSIGFFVDSSKALIWRGPMASNALKQLFSEGQWEELDYMIVDLPPGTGDIPITLIQTMPVTGAVVVSTPQNVAISDVRRAVDMFRQEQLNIPVLGIIENMAYFTPAELPGNKYYIFGKDRCKKFAEEIDIPYLGQVPIYEGISESGDAGKPVVTDEASPVAQAFLEIARNIAQQIAVENSRKRPED